MFKKLTRRKRNILITYLLGAIFLLILVIIYWINRPQEETYKPGEDLEGLTADLKRTLPEDYPRVTFTDVSEAAGINFKHFSGKRTSQLPEDMGSGAAWGDFNNDGWIDLFIANEAGPVEMSEDEVLKSPASCALYQNNGDGTFSNVSDTAGVDLRAWAIAPAWADYDNDGWQDLFVACYGKNKLYRNEGNGRFTDVSEKSQIGLEEGFWAGSSWGDFNNDGYLDLYVTGYVQYDPSLKDKGTLQYEVEVPASLNPSSFKPERNLLYKNNGNGTFTELAEKAGVQNTSGRSLSAAWCDLNDDGWPELYVANDVSDNVLYKNLGNETFEEISHSALVADYRGAMGIGIGDWDGDLDLDMFITHWIAQENALYNSLQAQLNKLKDSTNNDIRFMDEADRYGLGQVALDYIGFGTSFFDYDNDGKLDLFVTNGSTFQEKEDPTKLIGMKDQLFWNKNAEDGFYDISLVSGEFFSKRLVGRGAAFGDYDNDGDMDIYVVNNDGPGVLLRNDGGNEKSWFKLSLRGNKSNKDAVGVKIKLISGNDIQLRQVGIQCSYCSQNSLIQHFGLDDKETIDTLEIRWPSGEKQVFSNLPAQQTIQVIEGEDYKVQ